MGGGGEVVRGWGVPRDALTYFQISRAIPVSARPYASLKFAATFHSISEIGRVRAANIIKAKLFDGSNFFRLLLVRNFAVDG